MKNKLFSIALMVVAAIAIIAAPIAEQSNGSDFGTSSVTSTTTPVTSSVSQETGNPQTQQQLTTSMVTSSVTTASSPDEEKTTTTTVTTRKPSTTTTKVTTKKTATTTTPAITKATTTKATTKKPAATTTKVTTKKSSTTTTKVTTKKTTTTTTTTKKPSVPIENDAPKGTPVALHGQLSVNGADIVDQNGNKFQLLGISTHGVGWFPDSVSKSAFNVFRDDWGVNSIRLAMYIEESWGGSETLYLKQPERNYKLVTKGIDACIDLGMYVVVDWHILNPGDPSTHTKEAKEFFAKIAKEYGDQPNIIYEICNEPNNASNGGKVSWKTVKTYAEEVIAEIRKYDSDAIIICGTPTWSQDIHNAEKDRLSDKNTVYALHFYAGTHTDWLRNRVKDCYNKGLPILVSEFGTCDASGNTGYNASQTKTWLTLLNELNIGYFNWSFCDKGETASIIKSGVSYSSFSAGTSQLTESGKLIRELYRKRAGLS